MSANPNQDKLGGLLGAAVDGHADAIDGVADLELMGGEGAEHMVRTGRDA